MLSARRLALIAVLVSQSAEPDAPDFAETVAAVRALGGGVPVLAAPRGADESWAEGLLDAVLA